MTNEKNFDKEIKIENKIKENSIECLEVVRKTEFGAFLSAQTGNTSDDILLHKGQQTRDVEIGEKVEVFIYNDTHHRLTATMHLPQIKIGGIGYVEVLLKTRFGAFVDVGTERGIFLPFTETEGKIEVGQKIWVKLYLDKTGRLATTMHVDKEMQKIASPCYGIKIGGKIEGTVYNITDAGAFIITREKWIAFLYRDNMPTNLKMGDKVIGRVTYIRDDGRLNISLRPQKEKAIISDSQKIYDFMKKNNGEMFLTDKTDPKLIKLTFGLSKSAFKRAIGNLLKEQKIVFKENKIILK